MRKRSEISESIRSIFSNSLHIDLPADDEKLFEDGCLDSLGFVRLLSLVEEEFNIRIPAKEMEIENFNTIENIAQYVQIRINSDN